MASSRGDSFLLPCRLQFCGLAPSPKSPSPAVPGQASCPGATSMPPHFLRYRGDVPSRGCLQPLFFVVSLTTVRCGVGGASGRLLCAGPEGPTSVIMEPVAYDLHSRSQPMNRPMIALSNAKNGSQLSPILCCLNAASLLCVLQAPQLVHLTPNPTFTLVVFVRLTHPPVKHISVL
jgi:hypothetical protein